MRDYSTLKTTFWTDVRVRGFSDSAKLLYAYLLTGPHSNALGCACVPDGYIQADLKWTPETTTSTLEELIEADRIHRGGDGWTWVVRFLRHNRPQNLNVAKHLVGLCLQVPKEEPFYDELGGRLVHIVRSWKGKLGDPYATLLGGLSQQSRNGLPNSSETVTQGVAEPIASTEPNRTEPNPTYGVEKVEKGKGEEEPQPAGPPPQTPAQSEDELEVPASLRRTTVTGGDAELESVIERLTKCWPREEGLALARRKLRVLAKSEDLARIVAAGEAYAAAEEQKRSKDPAAYDSGKAKMLSNWLDDERWKDHRTPAAPKGLSRAYSITVVALGDRKWDPELDQGAEPTRAEKRQALDARHAEILAWDYQVDEWNKDYGPEPSTGEVGVIRTKQRKDTAA